MELIISRLNYHHLGIKISLKEQDEIRTIAIVNGNEPDFLGAVILLNIDQHVVYGLSHPEVISRILEKGPQYLLTNKETGHNLFEHGMKATLGKIKINMNCFNTTLETFYTLTNNVSNLTLVPGMNNQLGCLIRPRLDLLPILISNYGFQPKIDIEPLRNEIQSSDKVEIDNIRTHVVFKFKPDPTYGHTATK